MSDTFVTFCWCICNVSLTLQVTLISYYSARRLIGSRIIESATYCNQKLLAHLYLNCTLNTSVNWIIRLLLSLLCWPKVILLNGGHCTMMLMWHFVMFPWNYHIFVTSLSLLMWRLGDVKLTLQRYFLCVT